MLNGIEITTPWETMKRVRRAMKNGVKMWEGARFILADVPVDKTRARRILPWGMKPVDPPRATLFIVDYVKTAFTVPYREAAVLLHVKTPFGRGLHCCWMVVDDDTAMVLGRELLGYPKKMAEIPFEESAETIQASVVRRGTRVLTMTGRKGVRQSPAPPIFDIKTFNAGGPGQFYMIQPIWMFRPKEVIHEYYSADVDVTIEESAYDPLAGLIDGNAVNGRIAVADIVGSHYQIPVGAAGPQWVMNTYVMRFR